MIQLIVNADDLGLSEAVDRGVLTAADRGIVRSTSLLATGRTFRGAARSAREAGLGIGVHLALSDGLLPAAPAAKVPSLLDCGRFRSSWMHLARDLAGGAVDLDEVELELDAQVGRVADAGITPDHVDGHQHIHVLPGVAERVGRICARRGIRAIRLPLERGLLGARRLALALASRAARVPFAALASPGSFHGLSHSGPLDLRALTRILETLQDGTHELVCHPASGDRRSPGATELQALTAPAVAELVRQRGMELVGFASLTVSVQ